MQHSSKIRLLIIGALLAFSSIFQMGYANAYPNTAIRSFKNYINQSLADDSYSEEKFTWIWSVILNAWFVGFAIGSLVAVPIADRLGRKTCLLVGNVGNTLSAILAVVGVCAHLPWLFLLSRLFFAVSAGMSMNSLILLLQECSPTSLRGTMSFYAEMAFVLFNLVGAMAGMRQILGTHLPWLVGLAIFPAAVSVLVILYCHESPKYMLMVKHDSEKAARAIEFYQQSNGQETHDQLIALQRESREKGSIKELLTTPHLRKGVILGIVALQLTTSIWPIVYLSTELMQRANIEYDIAEGVSTAMLFLSSLCTVLGMGLVSRIPRRTLFLGCALLNVCALCLFCASAEMQRSFDACKWGCVLAVIMHGCTYSVAVGPIAWFITAELLPLPFRALGQSVALACNQLMALVLVFITLPLYNKIGALTFIPLFILPGILALWFLYVHLPETKDREIEEVLEHLRCTSTSPRVEALEMDSPAKKGVKISRAFDDI